MQLQEDMNIINRIFTLLALLTCNVLVYGQYAAEKYPIIPKPLHLEVSSGYFTLDKNTVISFTEDTGITSARVLQKMFQELYGVSLRKQPTEVGASNIILFEVKQDGADESYELEVSPGRIHISAQGEIGAFYAIQSLMQLYSGALSLEAEGYGVRIPAVRIEDRPALAYRGLLLDVGRFFMPIPAIKKYIDLMAYYKLNNLHLHLTEDQGWRIEIKKYPRLHQVGSWRKETLTNHHLFDSVKTYDGMPHGGYYTQDELRDLVRYAAARHVNIIPEIEMPGHSQAALAAYPQLACKDSTYTVSTKWGIHKEVLCPTEYTFGFLEDVLLEVMDIFPSKYIHIGGDECPKDRWRESEFCQVLIDNLDLKDEDGLQNYFMQRMTKFLTSHGRQAVAWYWDGADHMDHDEKPILLSWQGEEAGIAAVQREDYTIMTPHLFTYLDYYQTEEGRAVEPLSIANYLPLEKTYHYSPFPDVVADKASAYILGMQACLWAEYIPNEVIGDYKLFPRLCALAEVAWLNDQKEKDFDDFKTRLRVNVKYLDHQEVNYRKEGIQ